MTSNPVLIRLCVIHPQPPWVLDYSPRVEPAMRAALITRILAGRGPRSNPDVRPGPDPKATPKEAPCVIKPSPSSSPSS